MEHNIYIEIKENKANNTKSFKGHVKFKTPFYIRESGENDVSTIIVKCDDKYEYWILEREFLTPPYTFHINELTKQDLAYRYYKLTNYRQESLTTEDKYEALNLRFKNWIGATF